MSWWPTVAGPATVMLQPHIVVMPVTPVLIISILPATSGGGYTITYANGSGSEFVLLSTPTVPVGPNPVWTPVATNLPHVWCFNVSPASNTFYRIQSR